MKPCQTKSLGVIAIVSVISGKNDAAVSARVPVVEAPAMPIFVLPFAFSRFIAVSIRSSG